MTDELVMIAHARAATEWAQRHLAGHPDCPPLTPDGTPDPTVAGTPSWPLGEAQGHLRAALLALDEYERREGGG